MFLSWGLSTLGQVGIVAALASIGVSVVPEPGPYFYIYSLLPFYYSKLIICHETVLYFHQCIIFHSLYPAEHVPKISPAQYKVLGMNLSEKTWIYALSLQLLFSDGFSSVTSGLAGFFAGFLYMSDDVKLQNFRLPSVVEVCYLGTHHVGMY